MKKIISTEYVDKQGLRTRKTSFEVDSAFYDEIIITVQEKDEIGHWQTAKTISIPINSNINQTQPTS